MKTKLPAHSLLALYLCTIAVLCTLLNISPWKKPQIIQSDIAIYYSFLPAVFIYHDLQFLYEDELVSKYGDVIWVEQPEKGVRVQKCTYGLSLMNAPFFLLAHAIAPALGFPADGYSTPYHIAILFAGGIYALLGLIFLRLLLLHFFDERITALTILSLLFGTNLYYYSTTESPMAHAYGFFLITLFLWLALKWMLNPSNKLTMLLGLTLGLIVLIRPTNGIIALFLPLYGYGTSFRLQLNIWVERIPKLLLIGVCVFVVLLPQFFYWNYATEKWLYFSYGKERFFFSNPKLVEGLFSYRKGWLLYTPIMLFALLGIYLLKQKLPRLFWPVLILFILHIYIIYSWWAWWYGGSFGSRPMVDLYGLLALPLATFYDKVTCHSNWIKTTSSAMVVALVALNLFQTQQKRLGILHYDSMTKSLYWHIFGKLAFPPNHSEYEQHPDYEYALLGKKERLNFRVSKVLHSVSEHYSDTTTPHSFLAIAKSPPASLMLNKANPYSPVLTLPAEWFKLSKKAPLKLLLKAQFYAINKKANLVLIAQFQNKKNHLKIYRAKRNLAKLEKGWYEITLTMDVPDTLDKEDFATCFLYSTASEPILIDDFSAKVIVAELY